MTPLPSALRRPITEHEIETFWRDGAVCLRGVIDTAWLETLAPAVDHVIASGRAHDVTERVRRARAERRGADDDILEDGAGEGAYWIALDSWRITPVIGTFATSSMLPEIAGQVLRASVVNLYTDQLLVKEPRAPTRTAFHVDEPYFIIDGEQVCTCWVPLDNVTIASGAMGFVRGSHRWGGKYKPNDFTTGRPHARTLADPTTEALPDIDREPGKYDIVYYECGPGDVTLHHARTAHGSGGNTSPDARRRALAIRYSGDDAIYRAKPTVPIDPSGGLSFEGEPFGRNPLFPKVWSRA